MPNIAIALPETQQSVSRPIITEIVQQIKEITKIPDSVKVLFPGEARVVQQTGTALNDGRTAEFLSDQYIHIEVDEDLDREAVGTTAVYGHEHQPIFLDNDLEVSIKPVYAKSNVKISFKYRTNSRTQAIRWRNDIRMKVSAMRDMNLHDVTYHYGIPASFIYILKEIHRLRESVDGYDQTFSQYMNQHRSPRLTSISDMAGKKSKPAISETQSRIVGLFDWDTLPERPEKDEQSATWISAFDYKFSYEVPIGCNIKYPIMIHNQLLPPELIQFETDRYDIYSKRMYFTNSLGAFRTFEITEQVDSTVPSGDELIIVPKEDEFVTAKEWPGTESLMHFLVSVEDDRHTLMNLTEMGDEYELHSDILAFIKDSERTFMTRLHRSLLQLQVFRDSDTVPSEEIYIDEQLNVKSRNPLDLRKKHRVRLAITTDIRYMGSAAWARLAQYPRATVRLLKTVSHVFNKHIDLDPITRDHRMFSSDIDIIMKILSDPKNLYPSAMKRAKELGFYKNGIKTVMVSHICSKHSSLTLGLSGD